MGAVFGFSALAIVVLMFGMWVLSVVLSDVSIVDLVWGLAFVIVAHVARAVGDPNARVDLLTALVTVWGLRLSGYLLWRNWGTGEDKRYVAMRKRFGDKYWWFSLIQTFGLQGALVLIVSLPVQLTAAGDDVALGWVAWLGAAVWLVGFTFETVGDAQLARFKAKPENEGQVMDRGLWRYTRHPNYFGDFTVWWGLFLVSLAAGGWWGIIGPIVMSVFLLRVSGVTMLERTITKRRPGYADYIARTSTFFPWPPKSLPSDAPTLGKDGDTGDFDTESFVAEAPPAKPDESKDSPT
jgi:steroid 5-alpha reductase family enzyme